MAENIKTFDETSIAQCFINGTTNGRMSGEFLQNFAISWSPEYRRRIPGRSVRQQVKKSKNFTYATPFGSDPVKTSAWSVFTSFFSLWHGLCRTSRVLESFDFSSFLVFPVANYSSLLLTRSAQMVALLKNCIVSKLVMKRSRTFDIVLKKKKNIFLIHTGFHGPSCHFGHLTSSLHFSFVSFFGPRFFRHSESSTILGIPPAKICSHLISLVRSPPSPHGLLQGPHSLATHSAGHGSLPQISVSSGSNWRSQSLSSTGSLSRRFTHITLRDL